MEIEGLKQVMLDVLRTGASVDVAATGKSMFPMFLFNCKLRVSPVNPTQIRRGDIIVFENYAGKFVAHRATKNSIDAVECRGDFLLNSDGVIAHRHVVGKITKASLFGRMASVEWWGARVYGAAVLATYPYSTKVFNLMARIYFKIFKIN